MLPLFAAMMSEDSDYTSDVNFPLQHQHNTSAHQYRGGQDDGLDPDGLDDDYRGRTSPSSAYSHHRRGPPVPHGGEGRRRPGRYDDSPPRRRDDYGHRDRYYERGDSLEDRVDTDG
jgi:hypothetical protein